LKLQKAAERLKDNFLTPPSSPVASSDIATIPTIPAKKAHKVKNCEGTELIGIVSSKYFLNLFVLRP
jgi:hypothetical protein